MQLFPQLGYSWVTCLLTLKQVPLNEQLHRPKQRQLVVNQQEDPTPPLAQEQQVPTALSAPTQALP
ncbi:hypothetical protein [Microseira wollei]|uniref:hypothetical protein n=1 Tax=Microseira wollei TaxID=467598 RepID=UPI001CFE590E|nr:hypothetical protein [Microseira wollei]